MVNEHARAQKRSDVDSAGIDRLPAAIRWPLRGMLLLIRISRLFGMLALAAGLISAVVGVATLDWRLAAGGLLQAGCVAIFLGLGAGRQHVIEASGPNGAFVIRVGRRRLWREERGLRRIVALIGGHFVWAASVRERRADPMGPVVMSEAAVTEHEARAAAERLASRVRQGEDLGAANVAGTLITEPEPEPEPEPPSAVRP